MQIVIGILEWTMDDSEIVAYSYLNHLGLGKIEYEPEGKSKPPDFLVNTRVAVEVRRLNQHEAPTPQGAKPCGLEELSIPVWKNIQCLLPSLGPPRAEVSWYVHLNYSRPVPSRKKLENAVREHLEAFRDSPTQRSISIPLFDNFTLKLFCAGRSYPDYFVMGGSSDYDSGGWVIRELEKNLKICIDEKTAKVSGIRTKYVEWWLVLIDHVSYGAGAEIQLPPHNWDKVILVNPLNHKRAFELR